MTFALSGSVPRWSEQLCLVQTQAYNGLAPKRPGPMMARAALLLL